MIDCQTESRFQNICKTIVYALGFGFFCFLAWQSIPNHAVAVVLQPGDILVADWDQDAIFHVDPNSGNRTIVSGGRPSAVGDGPMFQSLSSIALESDGSILVSTRFDYVYRVDPITGNRTVLSGPSQGSGAELLTPTGIALDDDGTVFLADGGESFTDTVAIRKIAPATGDRVVVSSKDIGSGPLFFGPDHITLDTDGSILLAANEAVFVVDPTTGNRTVISGTAVGSGPELLRDIRGIEISPSGDLLLSGNLRVNDTAVPTIFQVDRNTGDRAIISGGSVGDGVVIRDAQGFDFIGNRTIVMGQNQTRSLLSIDLQTGNRSVLSAGDNSLLGLLGAGPNFSFPIDVLVVPVPEPATVTMLAFGLFGLLHRKARTQLCCF